MTIFGVVANCSGPLMSMIAFISMMATNTFDIGSAFTTMYLFQYLTFAIIMLPMMLTFSSDAIISSSRITTFLQLPEQDPGIMVKVNELNAIET